MDVFRYGLRTPDTKGQYPRRFQYFSDFIRSAKLFCITNNLVLNWKKITRGLPVGRRASNDRASTIEEI